MANPNGTATRPAQTETRPAESKEFDAERWLSEQGEKVSYTPFQSDFKIELTVDMVLKYFCTPTKSGALCSEQQAVKFIMLCRARGLNPWEGDAYIVGYDANNGPEFNLITAHQALLKRAEVNAHYDGMDSGIIVARGRVIEDNQIVVPGQLVELDGDFKDVDDVLVGGWAKVYRKDRTHPTYRRLNLTVFNKGFGRWKIDPMGMIVKCAEGDALRSTFPNSLSGMFIDAEMGPVAPPTASPARKAPNQNRTDPEALKRVEAAVAELAALRNVEPGVVLESLRKYHPAAPADMDCDELEKTAETLAKWTASAKAKAATPPPVQPHKITAATVKAIEAAMKGLELADSESGEVHECRWGDQFCRGVFGTVIGRGIGEDEQLGDQTQDEGTVLLRWLHERRAAQGLGQPGAKPVGAAA